MRGGLIKYSVLVFLALFLVSYVYSVPPGDGGGGSSECYVYDGTFITSGTSCTLGSSNCTLYTYNSVNKKWLIDDSDSDNDYYYSVCGQDCNNNNANINPGVSDTCGNNIDENCDGYDDSCPFSVTLTESVGDVSGGQATVTLTATTNYQGKCCFTSGLEETYGDCSGSSNKIAELDTDSNGKAVANTTQSSGTTKTYKVICRVPP